MPKLKTRKSASTRFRVTGTGKLLRMKGPRGHFRRRKPANMKRQLSRKTAVAPSDSGRVRRMLGTGARKR